MSQKHSYTTADYLPWDTMLNLTHRLYKDGKYRMSLLVACGSFFGLRISDLLSLSLDRYSVRVLSSTRRRPVSIGR